MIEVQIPKDISNYESTLIGPLTARQTVFTAIAIAVEYVYYQVINYLELTLDMNTLVCIGIVLAIPILYLAMGKPYGMKPEVYVYNYFLPYLIGPKNRPYKTVPTYEVMLKLIEEKELAENNKNKNKKNNQNTKKVKKKTQTKKGRQDKMYA